MNTTPRQHWRKSSYSNVNDNCVEVADNVPGPIPVRDSKDTTLPALAFDVGAWRAFIGQLKEP